MARHVLLLDCVYLLLSLVNSWCTPTAAATGSAQRLRCLRRRARAPSCIRLPCQRSHSASRASSFRTGPCAPALGSARVCASTREGTAGRRGAEGRDPTSAAKLGRASKGRAAGREVRHEALVRRKRQLAIGMGAPSAEAHSGAPPCVECALLAVCVFSQACGQWRGV